MISVYSVPMPVVIKRIGVIKSIMNASACQLYIYKANRKDEEALIFCHSNYFEWRGIQTRFKPLIAPISMAIFAKINAVPPTIVMSWKLSGIVIKPSKAIPKNIAATTFPTTRCLTRASPTSSAKCTCKIHKNKFNTNVLKNSHLF